MYSTDQVSTNKKVQEKETFQSLRRLMNDLVHNKRFRDRISFQTTPPPPPPKKKKKKKNLYPRAGGVIENKKRPLRHLIKRHN